MTKKKKTVLTRRKLLSFIISIAFIVFVGFSAVTLIGQQVKINEVNDRLSVAADENKSLQNHLDELMSMLENGADTETILKYAREHGWVLKGENKYQNTMNQ